MITDFRMGDALRCVLVNAPGGANLAAPTESVVRRRPLRNSTLWRQSLARNQTRVTVGDWNRMDLSGLASARMRSGVRAWEVDRLHQQDPGQVLDLLEQVVSAAGSRGAEKVFLRVPSDSPVVDTARRVGFFPYYDEIHLTRPAVVAGQAYESAGVTEDATGPQAGHFGRFAPGDRTAPDNHGLFQLYCAATPQGVREGIGLTIDQWSDSQEPAQPRRSEALLKLDGKIVGWRMSESFGQTAAGRVVAHPSHPDVMAHLMRMSCDTLDWLVPGYQENTVDLLTRQGMCEAGRYIMLIKTVTAPVINREFSYVEA